MPALEFFKSPVASISNVLLFVFICIVFAISNDVANSSVTSFSTTIVPPPVSPPLLTASVYASESFS